MILLTKPPIIIQLLSTWNNMNVKNVITELKQHYPGKDIIQNPTENPTEIICEIDPPSLHTEYSIAIAVIDQSRPHYHKKSTEVYEILQGDLVLTVGGKDYALKSGEQMTIIPNQIHWAKGNGTWVKVTSRPGWTIQDHILADENK